MRQKEGVATPVMEHILEIQHEASGKFLDIKGALADTVRDSGIFPDWQIDANGVKFFNAAKLSTKEIDAMVGYNFIRFNSYNPVTKNYFEEQAEKFIKTLLNNSIYNIPHIKRLGVRTKYFMPCNMEFGEINQKIFNIFYKPDVIGLFKGIQKDFQVIIEVQNKNFQIKTCLGPVKPDEVNRYFGFKSYKFNKVGIYIDIDCFQEINITPKNIKSIIDNAMELTWDNLSNLSRTVGV